MSVVVHGIAYNVTQMIYIMLKRTRVKFQLINQFIPFSGYWWKYYNNKTQKNLDCLGPFKTSPQKTQAAVYGKGMLYLNQTVFDGMVRIDFSICHALHISTHMKKDKSSKFINLITQPTKSQWNINLYANQFLHFSSVIHLALIKVLNFCFTCWKNYIRCTYRQLLPKFNSYFNCAHCIANFWNGTFFILICWLSLY